MKNFFHVLVLENFLLFYKFYIYLKKLAIDVAFAKKLLAKVEDYKKITNFENTKTVLKDIKFELPEIPDIKSFGKLVRNKELKKNATIWKKIILNLKMIFILILKGKLNMRKNKNMQKWSGRLF